MKKTWIIIGASLIVLGTIIFTGVMTMLKWNFSKLSTEKYQTVSYKTTDNFGSICINSNTAKIDFVLSDEYKVECFESKKISHDVYVQNGTLTITEKDNRKWYDHIGIFFKTPKITVCLTKTQFNSLVVKNTTGDINVAKDFSFTDAEIHLTTGDIKYFAKTEKSLKLHTTTGDIKVSGISPEQLAATLTTGDITLSNVVASEKLNVKCTTGDVVFDKCDAGEIYVKTTTGDITGSLLSEKVFLTKTTTGDISVPQTVSGGKCELKTTTGDIKITVE